MMNITEAGARYYALSSTVNQTKARNMFNYAVSWFSTGFVSLYYSILLYLMVTWITFLQIFNL
jgi:hypothetical protein